MNNLQVDSHEFYARALLDPSRSLSTSSETDLKITEALDHVRGFIPAITILNDFLQKEQAKVDPLLAVSLCHHVASDEDWAIQKRIYQAVKDQDSDSLLFKEMLLKSAQVKDKYFFIPSARKAVDSHAKNGEIMQALVISYVRMDDFKKAFFSTRELVENQLVSTDFIVSVIDSLPAEQAQTAKNIYRLAIRSDLVSQNLHRVMQRFEPINDAIGRFKKGERNDQLTPIDLGVLLDEAVQREDIKLARRVYNEAINTKKMNLIVWEQVIDFEVRVAKDLTRAKRLFIQSPIEIELREGSSGSELDLHGHSYGCAALMVESCIRSYKEDTTLGDQLIVITGIGWKDNKNFLEMQRYVLGWIKTYWKKQVKVKVHPHNQGQLIISF